MSTPENSSPFDEVVAQLQAGSSMPAELLEIFSEEAEDHLRTIYEGLEQLKANPADAASLADVRRASHTLKGAAGAVNLQAATRLAHRMEDLLDQLAEQNQSVAAHQLKLFLATADQLQTMTTGDYDLQEVAGQVTAIYQQFAEELGDKDSTNKSCMDTPTAVPTVAGAPPTAPPPPASERASQFIRVPLGRLTDLVNLLGEMAVNRSEFQHRLDDFEARIADMQSTMQRLREATHHLENHVQNSRERDRRQRAFRQLSSRHDVSGTEQAGYDNGADFDQLEFDRFDDIQLLAQKLSEADNDAEIMSGEFRRVKTELANLLQQQQKLNQEAQQSLMRVRLIPLSSIVAKLQRTVRTVAGKIEKQVDFQVVGEQLELDKTVLDAITDPLLHLIRNALDHGIESPKLRAANGKPETATLQLKALNQGNQVTLMISDDGGGIDVEKVRSKAIEQQLISPADELSVEEIHALIFRPGFSTANQLTDVSGRGVGMDVVGDAIRKLKGSIHVESRPGQGTTFTICLPTTVGVSKALIVESKGRTMAIPLQSICQISKLDPDGVTRGNNEPKVCIGKQAVPLIDLGNFLGLRTSPEFDQPGPMLFIDNGVDQAALTVDSLVGSREIVVKSLGTHLKKVRGFMGGTIAGDGSVIPILDANEIVRSSEINLLAFADTDPVVVDRRNFAMVIDDSISVRRVTESLLKFSGWDVVTAKDGVDALETLAALDTAPDVFLCDMEMPRMDGLELIRQIREQPEFEFTPIVMVTSRASEKHRHKAFEAGATDYVVKPFNDEHLMGLITQLVQDAREFVTF